MIRIGRDPDTGKTCLGGGMYCRSACSRPIIRPHRSNTYVDVAYCCRPSSVVCRSVGRSVTLVSRAKTAEPMEMSFGLRTLVGTGNHLLDGCPDPPVGRGIFLR